MTMALPTTDELDAMADPAARVLALVEPARELLRQAHDLTVVDDYRAQAEALASYTKVKRLADEAQVAAVSMVRWAEHRLGQLLGPAVEGRPTETSLTNDVSSDLVPKNDRHAFRLIGSLPEADMAEAIDSGVTTRAGLKELAMRQRDQRVAALHGQGWSRAAIAAEVGCAASTVGSALFRQGLVPNDPHRARWEAVHGPSAPDSRSTAWTKADDAELCKLVNEGLNNVDIGRRLGGRSAAAVSAHLRKLKDDGDPRLPAQRLIARQTVNAARAFRSMVDTIAGLAMGLTFVDPLAVLGELEPAERAALVREARQATGAIGAFLKEVANDGNK